MFVMIKSVRLVNFFSFGDCTIDLESDLNVLVGINGSGKSNFLRAFQLLKAGMDGRLREQIVRMGGINSILYKGKMKKKSNGALLIFTLDGNKFPLFGNNERTDIEYRIFLTKEDNFDSPPVVEMLVLNSGIKLFGAIEPKSTSYSGFSKKSKLSLRKNQEEPYELLLPLLITRTDYPELAEVARALRGLDIYKLFNTVEDSPMRNSVRATGVDKLMPNGDNVFQILNIISLKSIRDYESIEVGLQDVNEYFQRFRINVYGQGSIEHYLQEKGLETPIHAAQISDGTLCYLCLLVALYQPDRGNAILFDEPERNLHPDMLFELSRQLEKASEKSQIILTTHAPNLLNQFPLRTVRVFEKDENNQTVVKKFTEEQFSGWYDEFVPGQMWSNGDLGGNRY
ncbi:MAG: hypothetical protein EOO61_07700 [Hymenobacter sp.]|nr:MAG: hypothetical protein EOO61_07700 [Hymenobacter sp.]